jgi:hypothetical protein
MSRLDEVASARSVKGCLMYGKWRDIHLGVPSDRFSRLDRPPIIRATTNKYPFLAGAYPIHPQRLARSSIQSFRKPGLCGSRFPSSRRAALWQWPYASFKGSIHQPGFLNPRNRKSVPVGPWPFAPPYARCHWSDGFLCLRHDARNTPRSKTMLRETHCPSHLGLKHKNVYSAFLG